MNNSITLVGRVGQNPTLKTFEDSTNTVAKFSLAVKEYSPNKEDKTMWIDVAAWNQIGDRVMEHIVKGREVVLQGRLTLSTYKKNIDGTEVQVTVPVVTLLSYHLCGPKPAIGEVIEVSATAEKRRSRKRAS